MAISDVVSDNTNVDEVEDEKPRTLFVGNVPREVHKREIEEIFGDIGPLKRCYIQYPRDGNEKRKQREDTTVAYVTFALAQDAAKALETLQSTKIGDNKINIKFAKARSEQSRVPFGENGRRGFGRTNPNFEPVGGAPPPKPKEPRPKPIKKKSRLIVRNLSFKVTDEKLKEYFEKFGEIKDVNILKKPNGKLVGCAFIQYQNIFQAAKAIKELNLKPFLGRPIAIDWALPKNTYQTEDEKNKKHETEDDVITVKDEPTEEAEDKFDPGDSFDHVKEEPMDVVEIKEESDDEKPRKRNKPEKRKRSNSDSESSDEDDEEDDSDSDEEKFDSRKKQKRQPSNDVEQGKTLFLRNLSFDTTEDDLKQFFEKFGPLEYALLCKDSLTEHPKGTGFVKFKNKSAADECLQKHNEDAEDFKLNRRQFNVSVALPREKVGAKPEDKQEKKTDVKPKADSRNLYLAREGFVRPGSGAAEGVSASDMHKRAALNKVKKQMMKNLNILISPTRLCVHNLPEKFSDGALRKLFKKHAGPGATITEAKVMRDMKDIQLDGKGRSKGHGFVNFTEHEHALKALRSVNNNPTVFTPNHRPIVEFSMENRLALKAKEKRALKSKEKNPNNPAAKKLVRKSKQESDDDDEEEDENTENGDEEVEKKPKKGKKNKEKKVKAQTTEEGEAEKDETSIPEYAGLVGKKGVQTVPNFKPKGKITRNSLKQKKTKKQKKIQERRQREAKIPSKRPIERMDKTEKIIAKHQKKLNATGEPRKKKKWYE